MANLRDLAKATPEQINRAEWRAIKHVLEKAQRMLEETGVRHSWMDETIRLAQERGKEPTP